MKTNQTISKSALETAFYCYEDIDHLTNDLVLTIRNTEWLNEKLTENRRSKTTAIAFYSLFEIVKIAGNLPKGYYVSNPQMKKFIIERFDLPYEQVLNATVQELEKIRNEYLN